MRRSLIAVMLTAALLSACDNLRVHDLYNGPQDQVVSVQANDTVIVTYIDAIEQDTAFIGQKHLYHLAPGRHTLVVEYAALFQIDADRHEKVSSSPIKVTFEAQPGKAYLFRHAEQKTLEDAKRFAKAPTLEIVAMPENTLVPATFEQSLPTRLLPAIRFENTEAYGFASDRAAMTPSAVAVPAPASAPVALPVAPGVTGNNTAPVVETMKKLWEKATPDQRNAFQEWIKNH